MNTIASLVRSDPAVAERAVLDLSDLFRAALGAGEGDSTLAEEVELAERYLAIEQLRLGDRLQVAWRKAEPLAVALPMPRLVLQPLVENAVLHGISRLPEGGTVDDRPRRPTSAAADDSGAQSRACSPDDAGPARRRACASAASAIGWPTPSARGPG